MYETHKFMALDEKDVGYFITQVGLSAASFGVSEEDVAAVGMALQTTFGMRCSPPVLGPQSAEPELQAICIEVSLTHCKTLQKVMLTRCRLPVPLLTCLCVRAMSRSLSLRRCESSDGNCVSLRTYTKRSCN